MAYRRKPGPGRASTFHDFRSPAAADDLSPTAAPPSSLAAQAIRASSSHRDSSLSSAYGESAIASARRESDRIRSSISPQDAAANEYKSMRSFNENESKYGFLGVLARKAKAILEDDNANNRFENRGTKKPQMADTLKDDQFYQSHFSPENYRKTESSSFQRSSDAKPPLLNYIGGTIKTALEEGLTMVENKTADIIQETRKLNIRRKGSGPNAQNQALDKLSQHNLPQIHADQETQLKASRDVANAMAAKAKLLLRELKTVKADLAFAKERCAQLEEENKVLRESHEKGNSLEDDDLIRLQLETLLAEKGRLAHENSVYARENRFLREIVEYHQLTMQDVVYVNEGIEEVTEVFSSPRPPPSVVPTPPDPSTTFLPEASHHIVPTPPSDSPTFQEPASPFERPKR